MAAEYVMAGGNYKVILCERGVRTFSDHSRNTLDLSVIPPAKATVAPADPGRPEPRHRQARLRAADGAGGAGGRGRRPADRDPSRPGCRRCPTGRSRSISWHLTG